MDKLGISNKQVKNKIPETQSILEELEPYLIYLIVLLLLVIGGLIGLGFLLYYRYDCTLFWSIVTPILVIVVTVVVSLIVQLIWWVIKKLCRLE